MKIIVCLDDSNGMMFNKRRQSRDINVIKDIEQTVRENKVLINEYSEILFSDTDINFQISDDFLSMAGAKDYCFIENTTIQSTAEITEIIIYKWNRSYPSDFFFDINCLNGFKLIDSIDFVGNSHEKITKEIYGKGAI